jgi:hypothetical protein
MDTTAIEDRENGLRALEYFHKYSKELFPMGYYLTFDELVQIIDGRGKASISGLGLGIAVTDTDWDKVEEAMESLAETAKGQLPASNNAFNMALSNRLQEIDFDAISEIASNTGSDLIKHSQEIGDKALTGLKGTFALISQAKIFIPLGLGIYFLGKVYIKEKGKKKGKRS